MAVKHKAERVEKPTENRLELLLRALQDINEGHTIGNENATVFEQIVLSLGAFKMPYQTEDYVNSMGYIKNVQAILIQACSNDEIVCAFLLQALYNAISSPYTQPPQPTLSIVLQIVDAKMLPNVVYRILHSGYPIDSLERALMTLCNWLSRWTLTPNLGPLVLCFMQGLHSEHHEDVITEVTLNCVDKLFKLLVIPQNRESVGPVVIYMLEKVQNQQEAFLKIKPLIPDVLHLLHKENSESSRSYKEHIVNLCLLLIKYSSGLKEMYEDLLPVLQSCTSTDSATPPMPLPNSLGRVGLTNLGNTCYMNSVLQALFMTKLFCNDVLLSPCDSKKLFLELKRLFALLQYSQRMSLPPLEILNLARPPGFQPGQQHDSSEFLGFLLDTLHEQETSNMQSGDGIVIDASASGPTVVQKSFGGKAVTASKCDTCNTQSEHTDYFRELQLSFPHNPCYQSVQKLLDYYLSPEKLSGDNQYHCDTCRGLTDGERVTRVVEPPSRLILTLKYFRYDTASQERTKLLQHVELDMSVNLNKIHYELYAVVVHAGSSMDSGHYYTYARDGDEWFRFNDILVSQTTFEELYSIRPPSTPYILFYRKQDCPDPDILPKSVLPPYLVDILSKDCAELDTERRRRPTKVYNMRNKRNDDPPPPGCGGGSFLDHHNNSRYIC